MFAKLLIVPLFIASSVVAVPAIARRGDVSLSDWPNQNLESYWTFKTRYRSLGCDSQTGTDFYNNCCSPLGATESLSDRPAECTPTTCAPVPTATVEPTPTYDVASVPTEPANDDENLPYCDDGDDSYDDGEDDGGDDPSYQAQSQEESSPPVQYDTPSPTPTYGDPSPSQDNSQPAETTPTQDNGTATPNPNTGGTGDVNTGGFATFYYQNGNAGACGDHHSDNDLIAAIDIDRYGDTGSKSSLCGQRVHIQNTNNGNTVEVIIADVCPSCANGNSIDLSVAAFSALASTSDGMVPIAWSFM